MDVQQFFLDLGLPPELVVFIVAAIPIVELRGAIPLAINVLEMPWYSAFTLAIAGNMLPVPFILLFLDWLTRTLGRYPTFERFFSWLFTRTRSRSGVIEKYRNLGLALFVAVPLPMTGAWTGAIAAVILGIPFRDALLYIFIGVVMAGVIVTALSLMGWWGGLVAGIALAALLIAGTLRRRNRQS